MLTDPRAAVEEELGTRLPESVRVVAVEETPDNIYLVLPMTSPLADGELSDRDLEAVTGGGLAYSWEVNAGTCGCDESGT